MANIFRLYAKYEDIAGDNHAIDVDDPEENSEYDSYTDINHNNINEFNEFLEHLYNLGCHISIKVRQEAEMYAVYCGLRGVSAKKQFIGNLIKKMDNTIEYDVLMLILENEVDEGIISSITDNCGLDADHKESAVNYLYRLKQDQFSGGKKGVNIFEQMKKVENEYIPELIKNGYITEERYKNESGSGGLYKKGGIGHLLILFDNDLFRSVFQAFRFPQRNEQYYQKLASMEIKNQKDIIDYLELLGQINEINGPTSGNLDLAVLLMDNLSLKEHRTLFIEYCRMKKKEISKMLITTFKLFVGNYGSMTSNDLKIILDVEPDISKYANDEQTLLDILISKRNDYTEGMLLKISGFQMLIPIKCLAYIDNIIYKLSNEINTNSIVNDIFMRQRVSAFQIRGNRIMCRKFTDKDTNYFENLSRLMPMQHINNLRYIIYNENDIRGKELAASVEYDQVSIYWFARRCLSDRESMAHVYFHEMGHITVGTAQGNRSNNRMIDEYMNIGGWIEYDKNIYDDPEWYQEDHRTLDESLSDRCHAMENVDEDFANNYGHWYEDTIALIQYATKNDQLNRKIEWFRDRIFTFYNEGQWITRFYKIFTTFWGKPYYEYIDYPRKVLSREGEQIQLTPLSDREYENIEHELYLKYKEERRK
jgi:hypothetical protein